MEVNFWKNFVYYLQVYKYSKSFWIQEILEFLQLLVSKISIIKSKNKFTDGSRKFIYFI